jgi:predicted amidohydrolase
MRRFLASLALSGASLLLVIACWLNKRMTADWTITFVQSVEENMK